ncbi:unnamed protein product [Brachionus calyciflorus]|uniref:Endonuclease/exonuclease/phosphatase domain-containing protein n=1 Tax=Brachionus calyciflorus TaxID=104777 RepID=A0A814RS12_9BILA|nr:unnamed protein product [Brachionus calyciflorus]
MGNVKKQLKKNIFSLNKNIFLKPATKLNKTGRQAGGLAIIIDKEIKSSVKFHSDRIESVEMGDLTLINVYLPFFNGSIENKMLFDQELRMLYQIINSQRVKNFVIVGEMNTDIFRTNHNSIRLLEFLRNNSLTLADIKQSQDVDYTYRKIVKEKCITSWIDHKECKISELNNMELKKLKILIKI